MSLYRQLSQAKNDAERQAIFDDYMITLGDFIAHPKDYTTDEDGRIKRRTGTDKQSSPSNDL